MPRGYDIQSRSTAGFDPNLMSAFSSRSCNRNTCDVDDNRKQLAKSTVVSECSDEVYLFTRELSSQAQTCSQPWEQQKR